MAHSRLTPYQIDPPGTKQTETSPTQATRYSVHRSAYDLRISEPGNMKIAASIPPNIREHSIYQSFYRHYLYSLHNPVASIGHLGTECLPDHKCLFHLSTCSTRLPIFYKAPPFPSLLQPSKHSNLSTSSISSIFCNSNSQLPSSSKVNLITDRDHHLLRKTAVAEPQSHSVVIAVATPDYSIHKHA